MGPKPTHIRLNDSNGLPRPPTLPFQMDLPSPRIGEAPPALSPLDAFAMHSRLLAKKFDDNKETGRRISRLPPKDVERELASRPDYFRNLSHGSEGGLSDVAEVKEGSPTGMPNGGMTVVGSEERSRPVSHYPLLGNIAGKPERRHLLSPTEEEEDDPPQATPVETPNEYFDAEEGRPTAVQHDYFALGVPRAASPEPVDPRLVNVQAASPPHTPSLTNSIDSAYSSQPRTLTDGSTRSQRSLAPPRSPGFPKTQRSMQSIRSVPPESGDEDSSVSGPQAVSASRKFSGSSVMSRPQSPYSPWAHPMHRSPSMTSEYSVSGVQKRNFSRPLSSSSNRPIQEPRPSLESKSSFETRPSLELPQRSRQTSAASSSTHPSSGLPSRQTSGDDIVTPYEDNTPRPFEVAHNEDHEERPLTSYTYTKYALPRGRAVDRASRGTRDSWIQSQFTWDKEEPQQPAQQQRTDRAPNDSAIFQPPALRPPSPAASEKFAQERQGRFGRERALSNGNRSRSAEPRTIEKNTALHRPTPSVKTNATSSTDRTITAIPLHQRAPSAELTPEEHLELGIHTHSNGNLNKSTYHLRLAARAGLPTGMLLYALACRHGWGMRPNQEEGVMWLRKAIEGSGLEVVDVEGTLTAASRIANSDPVTEAQDRKKRKAQFALAIYELGISYMNGWGCAKDKALAVRCYEIAGSWGDCDALAEAGFCYTQGVGCKKDLKKAAALYRKAAEGGMSMAGNSW